MISVRGPDTVEVEVLVTSDDEIGVPLEDSPSKLLIGDLTRPSRFRTANKSAIC